MNYRDTVLVTFAMIVTIAVLLPGAPCPLPDDTPAEKFSAARAMPVLRAIATAPHPTGSAAQEKVRIFLLQRLQALGFEPQLQHWTIRTRAWGETHERTIEGHNILVRLPGILRGDPYGVILFTCHYDSVAHAPGAGDDGAAVAAFVETLRALWHQPPQRNSLIFLFTDGEELGLLGARAFANEHPWMAEVKLVFNFEGRGTSGESILFETGSNNGALVREYAKAARWPFAFSLASTVYRYLPNDSDFSVFRRRGLPGLNFAFIGNGTSYHQPSDIPNNLDGRSLQHHGSHVLTLAQHFGNLDLSSFVPQAELDMTFFTLPGNLLILYDKVWDGYLGYGVVVLVIGLILAVLFRDILTVRQLLIGLLTWPLLSVLMGVVIFIPLWISATLGQFVETISDEGGASGPYGLFAAGGLTVLGASCWALCCLLALSRRLNRPTVIVLTISTAVAWALVVAVSMYWADGTTHAVAWPLLFATGIVAVWLQSAVGTNQRRALILWGAGGLLLIFWLPLLRQFHQVGSVHPLFSATLDAAGLAFISPFFFAHVDALAVRLSRRQLIVFALVSLGLLLIATTLR